MSAALEADSPYNNRNKAKPVQQQLTAQSFGGKSTATRSPVEVLDFSKHVSDATVMNRTSGNQSDMGTAYLKRGSML